MKREKAITIVAALVFFVLLEQTLQAETLYNLIELGTLKGGTISEAHSINNNNEIVGISWTSSWYRRACWFDSTGNRNNTDLGTLGGNESEALSINDNRKVVGGSFDNMGTWRACLFGGSNINIGGDRSEAQSINNMGQIVGRAGGWSAYMFDATGTGNNIRLGGIGVACSINDIGQIVGWSHVGSSSQHAYLFDPTGNGNNMDLDKFSEESMPSGAWSINNASKIVGYYSDVPGYPGYSHACIFDSTGAGNNIDLGTGGGIGSVAYSINNKDQIVGWSDDGLSRHACLFDSTGNGGNIDLNTLIDQIGRAHV